MCNTQPENRAGNLQVNLTGHKEETIAIGNGDSILSTVMVDILLVFSVYHADPQYGSCSRDKMTTLNAMNTARRLLQTRSGDGLWYVELLPGFLFRKRMELFYKMFLGTYFHICGTCGMDCVVTNESDMTTSHKKGILDENLRVRGVDGLRIADASTFPHIPSAPISATAMAVGMAAGMLINEKFVSTSSCT